MAVPIADWQSFLHFDTAPRGARRNLGMLTRDDRVRPWQAPEPECDAFGYKTLFEVDLHCVGHLAVHY
jgi:hypothetical protein